MQVVKSSIILNKPAREVFDFTLNSENTPKWIEDVIQEQANENTARVGIIYRNQSRDGTSSEFEVTELKANLNFVMNKLNGDIRVCYRLASVSGNQCELEYVVTSASDALGERFGEEAIQAILQKPKSVME